jgi:hypothetical protein
MSTNDDSASRRGRRPDQGDRRGPARQERDERWDQSSRDRAPSDSYQDRRTRDSQSQRGAYSNFSRHDYAPPEPAPQKPQGYYPENGQQKEPRFSEPPLPVYTPQPAPYEPEPPQLNYRDAGRDDLFAREPLPPAFDTNPFGSQGPGYQGDPYDQNRSQPPQKPAAPRREEPQFIQRDIPAQPLNDYEDSFAGRGPQETQASRFFLPEDEPQRQRVSQPDRGYAPPPPAAPQYAATSYPPQDNYGVQYQDSWDDEQALHDDRGDPHLPDAHGNELDEDFFADEDDLDHDPLPEPKRGRKKLIAAALAGAIVVGGSGAYLYKAVKGGGGEETATPYIHADNRPLKEAPGNPGGKQFPNGEKTIYDRLTPDGQQVQVASFAPPAPAQAPVSAAPAAGNSLEERIDEALKKAQRTGDAPQAAPAQPNRGMDQPTVVRGEVYRPDGTRLDQAHPAITPNIVDISGGQLPPPFGNAVPAPLPQQQAQQASPFRTAPVESQPAPQMAAAVPAPRIQPQGGFYVSLKSAPDEKAIQRDLAALTDKYRSVLGDVQVVAKIADLGAKGVTYRAVAGPLGSKQEAIELCQKIKGVGGDKACFVTN